MPGYQLLADFNRSRRVERTSAETSARERDPGAIVVANLDRDDRALPARVAAGPEVTIDAALPSKPARDDDPAPVLLAAERGTGEHHLHIAVTSNFLSGIRMLDRRKNVLRPEIGTSGRYDFGANRADVELFVEAGTLAGSPLRGFPTLTPSRVNIHRVPSPIDERRFSLTMQARPLAGGDVEAQLGGFTIAPWIMLDESCPLVRLYMVETESNHPSVQDLRRALADSSKLVLVPTAVATHDTWLQDQFALGCFHSPTGVSLALLHMPRLRRNYTGRGATTGLPNFIRSHFPSRVVALYDEFWRRTLPVEDVSGRRNDITFEVSGKIREALLRPFLLRSHLLVLANSVLSRNPLRPSGSSAAPPLPFVNLTQALRDIADWAPRVLRQLDSDIAAAANDGVRNLLNAYKTDLTQRRTLVNDSVASASGGLTVTARDAPAPGQASGRVVWSATISSTMADKLDERLSQMHASQNYGGNFHVGPPDAAAPYGRIFIGNDIYGREGFVDTELLNFLDKQRVQPLTQIDTSWLGVAHVDEIFSFVPCRRGGASSAIWLNSPKLALDILHSARRQYVAGLPHRDSYVDHPSPVLRREMDEGASPVTALFRGKLWHHSHLAGDPEVQDPPQFYIAMAESYNRARFTSHHTPWRPGPGSDRDYPARMTVRELRYFESMYRWPDPDQLRDQGSAEDVPLLSTNEIIEQNKLAYLKVQLGDVYPSLPLVLVPTIYDITREPNSVTGAYTPNAANLVIDGNRLIVPKPFGPRVKPVDAIAILTRAFTDNGQDRLLAGFNERWLRDPRNRLLGVKQWFRTDDLTPLSGVDDLHRLAGEFADGLTGMSVEERRRLILRHNRDHFRNGSLRAGWHELTIPEDTVDLFEVVMALAARSLGVEWRFADSWSYHLTSGEIHCGTNALRRPSFAGVSPWWEFYFQARE